jgi:hypothetical protein
MAIGSQQIPSSQVLAWTRQSHVEYMEGESLVKMIQDDLMAGRISIDGCRDIVHYFRDQGAPAHHPLEDILAVKGQRAGDAANRVARVAANSGKEKSENKITVSPIRQQ